MTSTYAVMGGWPALQRRLLVPKPHEGTDSDSDGEKLVVVTTAVAAGSTVVVRMDRFAPENASPSVVDQMERIERSLHPTASGDPAGATNEVQQLRSSPSLRIPKASSLGNSPLRAAASAAEAPEARAASAPTPGKTINPGKPRSGDWKRVRD